MTISKKNVISAVLAMVLVLSGGVLVFAQTATGTSTITSTIANPAIMPTLYNQSGSPVNTGGGSLAAGWYYLQGGRQIYYYGNGTYYDPIAGTYGGSVNNPTGAAGANLYNFAQTPGTGTGTGTGGTGVTPGLPNTGSADRAMYNWMTLAILGAIIITSLVYLARTTKKSRF